MLQNDVDIWKQTEFGEVRGKNGNFTSDIFFRYLYDRPQTYMDSGLS